MSTAGVAEATDGKVWRMRRIMLGAAMAAGIACGANPTAPGADRGLRLAADAVIDMTTGESRTLQVFEDGASRPPANYTWTSSAPGIVSVQDGLLRAGPGLGQAVITVQGDGRTATTRVWVQPPEHVPSTYRITLIYGDGIPDSWKPVFQWAAHRWEQVIRAALPPVDLGAVAFRPCPDLPLDARTGLETGTRIVILRSPPLTGAASSPCARRPGERPTVAVGFVEIAAATAERPDPVRISGTLALHEFGHVLGLVGVFDPPITPPWFDAAGRRYAGPLGLEGYRREFGSEVASIDVSTGHWPFARDIMHAGAREPFITKASVGALMDLGYPAAWYGAGY